MNDFIDRGVKLKVDVPFKDVISKEYEVREDETVGQLRKSVEKDLDISWPSDTTLLQDGRKLSDDTKLNEANIDVKRPMIFARK